MNEYTEIKKFEPKPKKFFHLAGVYRPLYWFEENLKKFMFDCRSCGQCILSTTGFVCPMRCPKNLRNGPCGGTQNDMCEVNPVKKCVWSEIYYGNKDLKRLDLIRYFQIPVNREFEDTSAIVNWLDIRIDGMHLAIAGKGNMLAQLIKLAFHIIKIRWRKFIHPGRYWHKHESHYMDV